LTPGQPLHVGDIDAVGDVWGILLAQVREQTEKDIQLAGGVIIAGGRNGVVLPDLEASMVVRFSQRYKSRP